MSAHLTLVKQVVPCPPASRTQPRRAQVAALRRTTQDMRNHVRRALELGQTVNAARLEAAMEHWQSTAEDVERESR